MALDATGEVRVVAEALSKLGLDLDALTAAEVRGQLRIVGDRLSFVDVRMRQTHVDAIDPVTRREVHRTLATVLHERRHRRERAEHLAAAAVGPDDEAAVALGDLGHEASERGDCAVAGALFMRAASLTADAEHRANYLRFAGDAYWNAADYGASEDAFEAAYVGSNDPRLRAEIALQIGQIIMYQNGPRQARDRLVAESERVEPHDLGRAAYLLVHAASTSMLSSDVVGALALARRADVLAALDPSTSALPASLMIAYLSLQHGDADEFDRRIDTLTRVAEELRDTDLSDVDLFLTVVGILHVYTERWDAGRVYLAAVVHRAKRRSHTATAALASGILAELCWRSGRWDEAWKLATSDLVTEVTLTGARLWLLAFTAHLDAGFGRGDECRARAQAALTEGEPVGFGTVSMWANAALGLLELGLGHPVAAAVHLDRVDALATAYEMVDPSGIWWQADHVEALVRSGRTHEARRSLARLEALAATSASVWPKAVAARCRAMMAVADDAEAWFDVALANHAELTAPFELARTLLCQAEHRVAGDSHLDPVPSLTEAIAIFDALGATSWSAQGQALRDTVETRSSPMIGDVLSASERRVAEAVAAGATNREAATSLFLSVKTVEFHLRNIYRKLGVRSRTELPRSLRR